ncbi:MAG: biotin synthase BioB [Verrucomicrobia bacterium]|nr:biotin synthase BioB [Verrucomicrobiota bacterium]MCF7709528.1 biotin synthase BioB [Verrucomicrobiota bacterium]
MVDADKRARIAGIGEKVLGGGEVSREDAEFIINIEEGGEIFDLMYWSDRVRRANKGDEIHLCSIVNIKGGGCPEDCKFCAQTAVYGAESQRHGLVDTGVVEAAVHEAEQNGVNALGLVAAWKSLEEGRNLDEVCRHLSAISDSGRVRADGSFGMIGNRRVAQRLWESGCRCYNHNLETSRRFFPRVCTTHSYDDRISTVRHIKEAGIRACCGGIIGMGETRWDRIEMAFELRGLEVDSVPLNILNPIAGTPFEHLAPMKPMEALKTIACFRLILPWPEIIIAGGRSVNLRELQPLVFMAGASALLVGNYLTTPNEPLDYDLRMIEGLGLRVRGM